MIYYNSWLSNNAHTNELQAQHNEDQAAAYYEALKPLRGALGVVLSPLLRAAAFWRRRSVQKAAIRELSALDDRMLKDIGISRSQILSVTLRDSPELRSQGVTQPKGNPAASKPAEAQLANKECQVIPLERPDRNREIQHHPNGRRHRYPLPLNAA